MVEPDWTLDDHLLQGKASIREIGLAAGDVSKPRVCFHLYPLTSDDNEKWGMDAPYCQRAKRGFEDCGRDFDVDYVGGHCGIEAWQDIMPTEDWLTETVPLVWEIARKAGMSFAGWSFEPRSGPYVSVSETVNVYDGSKLNELPPSAASRSFRRLKGWLNKQL